MLGCTGYSWIWIRSVCALCLYLEVHAYMYLAYATAVGPRLQGASENERTRISEPHGNTHLRPSHNDHSRPPLHSYAGVFQRMLGLSE